MKKNQIIEVEVTALSHEGSGVARHDHMAVFIPRTAPGDRLRARIVKVHKHYAFAIMQEMLEPSSHRVPADCPVYARCGGCALRHLAYGAEAAAKDGWVRDNLARIGGVSPAYDAMIPAPSPSRYRNKAQYPVRLVDGRVRVGFFAARSHRLIPVDDCLLQPAFFADIARAVTAFMERYGVAPYDEDAHSGVVRHLYIRHAGATGQVMVCLVVCTDALPYTDPLLESLKSVCPQLATLVLSHNKRRTNVITGDRQTVLYGPGYIEDTLCGVRVRLSPASFYQVNRDAAELLYGAALEYAAPEPGDLLLDLYCGAGTVGLSMAHAVREVVGVELVAAAVEDARRTAARSGISNARFLHGDAAQAARLLLDERLRPDIAVLDPPRKGAAPALLETLARMEPTKIVYISCDSATLARDCRLLGALGYETKRARAVDLFARTAHVESVALLEK